MRDRKNLHFSLKEGVVKLRYLISFPKRRKEKKRRQKEEKHFIQGVGFQSAVAGARESAEEEQGMARGQHVDQSGDDGAVRTGRHLWPLETYSGFGTISLT